MKNLIILFLILLLGCEFPLEEENIVEISPESVRNIKINLLSIPDTLEVIEDIRVSYELPNVGSAPIALFILINNNPTYLGYFHSGEFVISKNLMLNTSFGVKGYVPFEFIVLTTSGTNSLADRSQRELVDFTVKRTLYFDYSPTASVNFTKIENKNGNITLYWDKYPHRNLHALKLVKTSYINGSTTPRTETVQLQKNAISYQDQTFLGSEIEFTLISENNLLEQASGLKTRLVTKIPKIIEFKTTEQSQLLVKWDKVSLYNNSLGYKLNSIGTIFTTSDPFDTVTTLTNFPIGSDIELDLRTLSRDAEYDVNSKTKVWLGEKIIAPKAVISDHNNNFFFLNSPYLIRSKNGVRDSAYFNFLDSGPSHLSQETDNILLSTGMEILEISKSDLQLQNTYPIATENVFSFVSKGSKIIAATQFGSSFSKIQVFDKISGAIVQNETFSSSKLISRLQTCSNPEYLIGEGNEVCVFSLNSDGLIASYNCVPGSIAVLSRDGNYLYVFDGYNRLKYTFPSLELVNTPVLSLPYPSSNYSIDRNNFVMGISKGSFYDIIDIETLNRVKQIPITDNSGIRLVNGTLFVESGTVSYTLELNF
ncbi:MAG: hypothetical protein BroJett042_16100 [Bacteroidota bacterium]|nr:MAG: hypothetical protein BroJett042_16100 [Bacteroidota bacterium]